MPQRKGQHQAQPRAKKLGRASARAEPKTIEDWQRECERLNVDLTAAREEISTLRLRQEQVLNRIAWALDTLDSLSDSEA